jgi:hypothetical protein
VTQAFRLRLHDCALLQCGTGAALRKWADQHQGFAIGHEQKWWRPLDRGLPEFSMRPAHSFPLLAMGDERNSEIAASFCHREDWS